jgi:hypothetical protein
MKDKDLKYEKVLDILKKTEPVLDDAGALTDRIMQRVEQTNIDIGKIRVMRIAGMLSGVAASALICLLAYETMKYPVSPVENYSRSAQSYISDFTILQDAGDKEKIIETVIKRRVAQRVRKEQLREYLVVHNKIVKSF